MYVFYFTMYSEFSSRNIDALDAFLMDEFPDSTA